MAYTILGSGSASLRVGGNSPSGYSTTAYGNLSVNVDGNGYLSWSLTMETSGHPYVGLYLSINGQELINRYYNNTSSSAFPRGNGTSTSGAFNVGNNNGITCILKVGSSCNHTSSAAHSNSTILYRSSTTIYGVTFNLAGGTRTGGGATYQECASGGSVTPPTVERTGYTFSGWSDTYTNVTSDRTITAQWTGNKYKLTFDPNGGTLSNPGDNLYNESHTGSNYVEVQYGTSSYSLMVSDIPTRQNYTFMGWFDDDDVQVYDATGTCMNCKYWSNMAWCYTGDATVYAKWTLNACSILYYNRSYTKFIEQIIPAGTTGTIISDIPKANGYTCIGWSTSFDAHSVEYSAGDSITLTDDIILYPVWRTWTYTLSYDKNGGKGTLPSEKNISGDNGVIVESGNLTGQGAKFVCWNTEPDGSGNIYYPGDLFNEAQDGGTAILFAMYINTEVYAYKNGTIECVEFIEDENCTQPYITKDGCIVAKKFVEHDNEIWISFGIIYAKSFIEKELVLTAGGADKYIYMSDSFDNILVDKNNNILYGRSMTNE